MFYGIIMDTIRDGILRSYGVIMWKRIVHELKLPSETFDFYVRYDDHLLINICDCMVEILNDGTRNTYLEFFGANFIHYFYRYGFDKILRVAGRTFGDFLYAIDQLHDSNRFTFQQMQHPLFHVTEENEKEVTLIYKSIRHGLAHFAIGSLKAAASLLFNENHIDVTIQHDLSTHDYSHIVFSVQFDNKKYEMKRYSSFPPLPDLSSATFFRVFPFAILMDSTLHIHRVGEHIWKIFPDDAQIIGRPLDEVFRLIRPDIHVEWDKILSYGRHIVFLMENRLPLRAGSSGTIRLKGQMKYIHNKNMLWFLCHPVLGSADDMISAGLHLTDLNLFDGASDLLITGIHQERELTATIFKQNLWTKKSARIKRKLSICHKRNRRLLYSTMPKHIALLLQSGIQAKSLCECQPLVTIMFAYVMDLKTLTGHIDAAHAISCLNKAIVLFDTIADKFDVFKMEIKADASYMVVAGIHDQSYMLGGQNDSQTSLGTSIIEGEDENKYDEDEEEEKEEEEQIKNPFELNSTEIIAALSLELVRASKHIHNPITNKPFDLKFGFHSGMAISGIVGTRNYQYCLFGDTVKTASQITNAGEIGRIHLSQAAYSHLVAGKHFTIEHRGQVDIKGKGSIDTYWLTRSNEKFSTTIINNSTTSSRCPFSGHDWTVK